MPNAIKYSTTTQTLALKDGNFWIATGDVSKGTTVNTDYWNGITPPANGYTIYLNKASQGPSIYVAADDTELISLTNRIAAQNFTTVAQSLNWYNTQTDKIVSNIDYPAIPTDGITFICDIGTTLSYPKNGITASSMDPVGNGGFFGLQNGPSYVTEYGGGVQFDGADDVAYASVTSGGFGIPNTAAFTWIIICRSTAVTNVWSGNASNLSMTNNNYSDGTGFHMANGSGSTRGVQFWVGNTTTPFAVNLGTITPSNVNVPHMYVISSNGTNLHKGYVDNGSPISSSTTITRASAQREIFVARNGYTSTCTRMISYVKIYYNRQLSDAEVLQLYSAYQGRFGF